MKAFSPLMRGSEWGPSSPTLQIDPTSKLVLTTGPFRNILLPYETPKANALQLLRSLISTYLVTHPHLDHFAGFAINTAAFHNTSRPKKVAALPQTIDAIKSHVFNDVVWPNMSDEEGGIGFVSYMRLIEGGNVALGEGEGRGYIEVCEGLEVKARCVSHGHAMKPASLRVGTGGEADLGLERRLSHGGEYTASPDPRRRSSYATPEFSGARHVRVPVVTDSTAFFIRAEATGDEILVFGDVEPDTVSMAPRNAKVWADAAPKIVSGSLKAVFIECSYTDTQTDETLYGHLAPRHLMAELAVLAEHVEAVRLSRPPPSSTLRLYEDSAHHSLRPKRKRQAESLDLGRSSTARRGRGPTRRGSPGGGGGREASSLSPAPRPRTSQSRSASKRGLHKSDGDNPPEVRYPWGGTGSTRPLSGLRVVIIHIKDALSDTTNAGEVILKDLQGHAYYEALGVEFVVPTSGGYMYL